MIVLASWAFGLLIIALVVLRVRGMKGFWRRFVVCSLGATIGAILSAAFLSTGIHHMILEGLRANLDLISRLVPLSPTIRRSMEELEKPSVVTGTVYLGMAIGAFVCWPHKKRAGDRDRDEVTSDQLGRPE